MEAIARLRLIHERNTEMYRTACGQRRVNESVERSPGGVREQALPMCVRDVLDAARAARPEADVTCLAFRTVESGLEIARMGPLPDLFSNRGSGPTSSRLDAKDVLVLSVTVTETTFENVRTVTHVLVTHTRPRDRSETGPAKSCRDHSAFETDSYCSRF